MGEDIGNSGLQISRSRRIGRHRFKPSTLQSLNPYRSPAARPPMRGPPHLEVTAYGC